jgi:hypothetical protein
MSLFQNDFSEFNSTKGTRAVERARTVTRFFDLTVLSCLKKMSFVLFNEFHSSRSEAVSRTVSQEISRPLWNPFFLPVSSIQSRSPLTVLHPVLHIEICFNPLKTKCRLLYLKTQSVPRCKHFSSRL